MPRVFLLFLLFLFWASAGFVQAQGFTYTDPESLARASNGTTKNISVTSELEGTDFYANATSFSFDLEKSVERALQANPGIDAVRRDLEGAGFGVKSDRGALGPDLFMSYNYRRSSLRSGGSFDTETGDFIEGENDTYSYSLGISQDLFTGFRKLSEFQRAKLQKENAGALLENAELTLILIVQENFFGLLQAKDDVRSAKDSVARLLEQLKVVQAFYDVGLQPRLDLLQAEVDLAQAENLVIQAQNAVDTQIARLNTLLNIPVAAKVEYAGSLSFTPFPLTLEECLQRALDNRPDLFIAEKSVEIAEKDAKIARSPLYPQVSADLSWNTRGNTPAAAGGDNFGNGFSDWTLSLGANWTFFQFGEVIYAGKEADKQVESLKFDEKDSEQEAKFEVTQSYLAIREAADRIGVARKALDASLEQYRNALARYQAQVGINTDVLDAQADVTESESDLTQALADYQIAVARLFNSMGQYNKGLIF
jgi:outer membrane protein